MRKRSKILQPSLTFSHGIRAYLPSQVPHLLSLEASPEVWDLERGTKKGLGTPKPVGKRSSIPYSFSRKDTWYLFSRALKGSQSQKKTNPTQKHSSGAMVYKCRGLQAHSSCTTRTAQIQLISTPIIIAFIPTEPFERFVSLSKLLALFRKQGKVILCGTELSSESLHLSIFHLDQECLFEDHLPVVSTQSAVAHTAQTYWGP